VTVTQGEELIVFSDRVAASGDRLVPLDEKNM